MSNKINKLFKELEQQTKNASKVFESSGMVNRFNRLDIGFFPLGTGILSDKSKFDKAQLSECKIMILGNDFGTENYLENKCKGNRESASNPTISNLINGLKLDLENTFFTNFHLGVRKEGTNTKRIKPLEQDYKKLCFEFFIKQIELIDPQIVICLGHDVRKALAENSELFTSWKGESKTLKALYVQRQHEINILDKRFGKRKFIVVPHPCDTRNFTKEYIREILNSI